MITISEKNLKERIGELFLGIAKETTGDAIRGVAEEIADMDDDEIKDLILSIRGNLTPETTQKVLAVLNKAAQEYAAAENPEINEAEESE